MIYYIANARIPTEKAHGIHIMKMCEAFMHEGEEVTLFVPRRRNEITEDPFSYYGIKKKFPIEYVPVHDTVGSPLAYWLSQISFSFSLLFFEKFKKEKEIIIFTRDMLSGFLLSLRGLPVFFDMHGFPEQFVWFWKMAMKRMRGIVLTNKQKFERAQSLLGISEEKLFVFPNGYDPELFKIEESKKELRKKFGFPSDVKIALYTGHLYSWKGASILADAGKYIPGIEILFVGGTKEKIKIFKEKYKESNFYFLGHKPYTEIPKYLKMADVLILPNSGKSSGNRVSHSIYDTSPIKMFEYMASGTPIIATDLPSIREILNKQNTVVIPPDDPKMLADAIKKALDNPEFNISRTQNALRDVEGYTWQKRAHSILNFIHSTL